MKRGKFVSFSFLALSLALAPIALASTTWYVDGVTGSDSNDCKSATTVCKMISHAIGQASSGDSFMIAPATYAENLTVNFSLNVVGASSKTTIIDGGGGGPVVAIPNTTAHVAISKLTIRNGSASLGRAIFNAGTLTIYGTIISGNSANRFIQPSGGGAFNYCVAKRLPQVKEGSD
jgi:hypothetical protein